MGKSSNIDYVDASWNPWQGCHPVSEGCVNCYMYRDKRHYGQDPATVVRSSDKTFNAPPPLERAAADFRLLLVGFLAAGSG